MVSVKPDSYAEFRGIDCGSYPVAQVLGTVPHVEQRGFTLLELAVVVAILAGLAAVPLAIAGAGRPLAMRSAVVQFDAAVAYARTLAATDGNGATIVFAPRRDAAGDVLPGFTAQVFAGRPTAAGSMRAAPLPDFSTNGSIHETAFGDPPFSVFFNGEGSASGMHGAVTPGSASRRRPGVPLGRLRA